MSSFAKATVRAVRTLRLKISDLFEFEGTAVSKDEAAIAALAAQQFTFLPKPLAVRIEGDDVLIEFQEESKEAQAEALRLAERAEKRAREGNFEKAIGISKRALELQPSLHIARRNLAMSYVEIGDVDNATNHLIEVLRVNPADAWSWVVLANLYTREKSDKVTGEKFLRKALEIQPDDAWALNSLAVLTAGKGKLEDAVSLFEQAIRSKPEFPNAYHGLALVFDSNDKPQKAAEALERLFAKARMQDARSKTVFDQARQLSVKLQFELAEQNQSNVFKITQNYKAELEQLSGFPVRVQEDELEGSIGAIIQMAWKYNRDYHLLKTRASYPVPLVSHIQCHELTHLKFESLARKAGKNLFFASTEQTRETALLSISYDLRKSDCTPTIGFPST